MSVTDERPAGDFQRIADVQRAVALHYGISVNELCATARGSQRVARARALAMYLARKLTRHSSTVIGRSFDRDHSAVLRAVRIAEMRVLRSPARQREVNLLIATLDTGLTCWRERKLAAVDAFDAGLNRIGLELAIVPIGSRDGNGFFRTQHQTRTGVNR